MKPLGNLDCIEIEERILRWWEENKIYPLIKAAEPQEKKFFFIDGPPFTSGDVHLGTAWNKIMKDMVIRYKRMRGFRVTDTPGYDTHGLPIEVVIEKKLGIKNKQEIINYGLDKFISACREFALGKIDSMNAQFKRLGCSFWNWDNPYVTLTNTYMQGIWWTLKHAWQNGFLYKFYKPQNCCPRCATALAKHEFDYQVISDTAIYVKFQSVEDSKTWYIIWTTTPWTLTANTNIMANPDSEYVKMRVKDEYWIMGMAATADLLQNKLGLVLNAPDGFEYGERYQGYQLEGKRYIHPLAQEIPIQAELEKQEPKVHTIILSREYVQESGGSGLVHSAPGHGPEDFEVGMANGIPVFSPVDMQGYYTEEAGPRFKGKYVHDVNQEIMDLLQDKRTLVFKEGIEHEYAHCWRCHTKLVYRATEQWFFKTSALRDQMLKENEQVFWIPDYAGNTVFKSWLMSLQDWCISRQRYWGVPLPIWTCSNTACDHIEVIGSMGELKDKAGYCPEDIHKPWIDEVKWACPKCHRGTLERISDVMDVWLDSGSAMWASQLFVDGYEHYDTWEPVDFIIEGKDQIRGWFNSLICSAMVSSLRRNYNTCYMSGWVTSHGVKLSKSLGTAISPENVINGEIEILSEEQKEELRRLATMESVSKFDKTKDNESHTQKKGKKPAKPLYIKDDKRWSNIKGVETFRFYSVMGTPPGKDLNFDYKEYTDTFKILNTLWNVYLFAQEKMQLNGFNPQKNRIIKKQLTPADRWILSRINSVIEDITVLYEKYELPTIPMRLQTFIMEDLSHWYITLIRDQVDINNEDPAKFTSLAVLWYLLYRLCVVMAPLNPMLMEDIYQKIFREELSDSMKMSIHLERWPKVDKEKIDPASEQQMNYARQIIEQVRSVKTEAKIKMRWPTKSLLILPKKSSDILNETFHDLIQDMSNVKNLTILSEVPTDSTYLHAETAQFQLFLDVSDSLEIQQERVLYDLLRTIQFLRKQYNLHSGDPIRLTLATSHPFLKKTIMDQKAVISTKVNASEFLLSEKNLQRVAEAMYHDFHVHVHDNCYAMVREKAAERILAGTSSECNYCEKTITAPQLGIIQIQFTKF